MTTPLPLAIPAAITFSAEEWAPVAPERIVTGTPQSASRVLYTSADGTFCTGIYACTEGKWRVSYSEDEFCTLLEGAVTLTPENGAPQTYTAPESFLIPAGFKGFWEPLGHLRKIFVVYEPGV